MKLLIQSAMIFFGTLMAAAVVALGEPGKADVAVARTAVRNASAVARPDTPDSQPWFAIASIQAGYRLR